MSLRGRLSGGLDESSRGASIPKTHLHFVFLVMEEDPSNLPISLFCTNEQPMFYTIPHLAQLQRRNPTTTAISKSYERGQKPFAR